MSKYTFLQLNKMGLWYGLKHWSMQPLSHILVIRSHSCCPVFTPCQLDFNAWAHAEQLHKWGYFHRVVRRRSHQVWAPHLLHIPALPQQAFHSETRQHVLLQTPKSGRHTLIHTVLISLFHSFSCSPRIISDFLIRKPRQMNTYILELEKDPGKISVKWARI